MTYAISTSNSGSGHQQGSNSSPSHLFQASANNNNDDEDLQPIIDPRQNSRALNDAASILKDCGLDNVCIPDLKIAHHMSLISPSGVISQVYLVKDSAGGDLFIYVPENPDFFSIYFWEVWEPSFENNGLDVRFPSSFFPSRFINSDDFSKWRT